MKIVAKPIDTIVVFKCGSKPLPYKFKYREKDETTREIYVGKILVSQEQRIAGQRAYVYDCQSEIEGIEKRYQLKYLISDCRWELYKI
ncbi:MAG: hypothetical protein MJ186_03395 [Clostridia bacterium]|nr:hypothetical protein [Clostridia bacterium]